MTFLFCHCQFLLFVPTFTLIDRLFCFFFLHLFGFLISCLFNNKTASNNTLFNLIRNFCDVMASAVATNILKITKQLNAELQSLRLEREIPAVSHIYYPLDYAYDPYKNYVNKYCNRLKNVLYVGMNPSPHGMCQTGVPFGDVDYVKNWLKISGDVKIPRGQHPRYPIVGFSHRTSEVSGSRLWGFLQKCYGDAERFFEENFVVNYCPVAFISGAGSNVTPESKEIMVSKF